MIEDDIRHEFGHVVVAKILRFETGAVSLLPTKAKAEIHLRPRLGSLADVSDYLRNRIQVLYGGAGAQALGRDGIVNPVVAEGLLDTTAMNDHAKIRELLRIVSAVEHPDANDDKARCRETTALDNELRAKTGALIERHSELIFGLTEFFISQMGSASPPFTLPATVICGFPGVQNLASLAGSNAPPAISRV
jgi:hypothetical protein